MKKLLICLLFFSSCKKENAPSEPPKPTIQLSFKEYPSGNIMAQMPVRIGYEKRNDDWSYSFVEDKTGMTDKQGNYSFKQSSNGQYIRAVSPAHMDFSYHLAGYHFIEQPISYGYPPSYPEAKQIKQVDQILFMEIPLYRKTEIQLHLKQVTPTSQLSWYTSVAVSNQALEQDTTAAPFQYWHVMNWIDLKQDVLIDTIITVPLFSDYYNCIVSSVADLGGFGSPYPMQIKTPKFKPVNGQNMITLEF